MKTILILFITTLFFISCSKKEEIKTSDSQKNDSASQINKEVKSNTTDNAKPNESLSEGIKDIVYETDNLPKSVKYEGKIVAGAKWEDKNGKNVLIICETEEKSSGDNRSKELFGYQYLLEGENAKMLWKVNDFIKDCPVDVSLALITGSLTVTDINKDGIAENTFLYRMSCKGDVSPDDMKLIMHEGENKYAIRGEMIQVMNGEKYGGQMNTDPSFNKAPAGFFAYAREQWKKYETEKIGNQ
ncbi:MAG: hypothetical protein IT280_09175 [Ignavibacteria bacterium]|nr:hypothetical protein [Ignavibacteria bacterium]